MNDVDEVVGMYLLLIITGTTLWSLKFLYEISGNGYVAMTSYIGIIVVLIVSLPSIAYWLGRFKRFTRSLFAIVRAHERGNIDLERDSDD